MIRFSFILLISAISALTLHAQSADSKIWTGTFSAAQAERGKANFKGSCERCHGADLAGVTAPSLKGDRFMTAWETENLYKLFVKIRDTMPPNFGTTLTDDAKLDVMAFILQSNSFPTGTAELKIDSDQLESILILRKGAQRPAVPNFAVVQVVGCLAPGPGNTWVLTNTSEPVVSRDSPSTPEELKTAEAQPLGNQTFRLVSVNSFKPELYKGQKMEAKGLLYREPNESRLNVTSLQTAAPSCVKN